ncbi:hypothetical protein ACFZAM_36915 [Streptomyces sp. NPDC008079]|uniref:hypothetical protein n=1 Tax=Streptomyces sp. NPDC008079 TaxID=3364806 RepID=UPI0036E5ADEF
MRRSPRTSHHIDHLTRLVDNLLDDLAARGRPAPTAPQIRTALRELQRSRRSRRRPSARR